ncbi:atg26 [Symbiodinium sp. CCMP2456]|nr:atg26 [Symbiodinium sp. CCMP2456]
MGVTPGPEECIRAYGVRCITLGATPFKLRDDTSIMSDEEVAIFRRSMNPREYLELEKKYSVSWNLDDSLPDALRACRDLMQQEHFDAIVCSVITAVASVRLLKMFPHLCIIRTAYSFASFVPPTRAWPPAGYTDSPHCYGFFNKLKHYHFLFFRLFPFIMNASHAKREQERVREIEGVNHDNGLGLFAQIAEVPELGLWSKELQPPPSDFPASHTVTGCIFTPKLEDWKPSEALDAFMQRRDAQGRKPAVITFGSMMSLGIEKVQNSTLQALQKMGMNVVNFVSKAPKKKDNSEFTFTVSSAGQEAGAGVFELDYAPFDWLLPLASVVICHGGAGTTFRSLWAGVPVVVCPVISPLVADQYGHGEFLERKALGSMIEPTLPSVEECQVAIERALGCAEKCMETGIRMQKEDGAAEAAAAVERSVLQFKAKPAESRGGCCVS